MASNSDMGSGAFRTALSPGQEAQKPPSRSGAPRIERTLQLPGVSPRPTGPPGPRTPEELAPTMDASARSSPISSDRLAQLAAHLPRVPRDTYEIGTEVAKGGIGRVVRARDQRLDRPVAIKELLVWNEAQEQRFVHEALLTARLQHPSIVPIYEAGRWPDGEPFYAMKLVSGRSLADLIQERKRLEDRLSLLPHVLAVAQAIAYAHTQRILHRDLKPANVLVGEFGETVVIDWGLAKGLPGAPPAPTPSAARNGADDNLNTPRSAEPSAQKAPSDSAPSDAGPDATPRDRTKKAWIEPTAEGLTIEGAVVGTPAYMPPEQAAGEAVDERADIYALGAMLYHLIAAVPPYHDTPWEKLLSAIVEGPPKPLEKHVPTVADELAAIVHKAMARERSKRYATAKELADDLERLQTGQIVAAHTYSASHLLRRFWRRNRPVLSIALAAVTALALVIAYAFVRTDQERRYALSKKQEAESAEQAALTARRAAEDASKQATSRADELTLLQAQDALGRDPNQALAWLKTLSPEFTDASEMRRIAADAQARGLSRAYRGHTGHVNSIVPFEGGKSFITASDDKTLRVWNAATGESIVLAGHTDEAWFSAISEDYTRIVSVSKDLTARLWDRATGKELAKVSVPNAARQVLFTQDGSIIGTPRNAEGGPWIWRSGAASVEPLARPGEPIVSSAFSWNARFVALQRKDGAIEFGEVGAPLKTIGKDRGGAGHWNIARDGHLLLWVSDEKDHESEAFLLDTRTGARKAVPASSGTVALFLSERGDHVVIPSQDEVAIYDVAKGAVTKRMPGHGARVYAADFSDDDVLVATGGYDRAVKTWDITTGEMHTFAGLEGVVSTVRVSPDHARLFAASSAGDVRIFEPGRAGRLLVDHRAPATGLAVSADGLVATADENGRIVISDMEGRRIAEHTVEASSWLRLRASPDRRRFIGYSGARPVPGVAAPASQRVLLLGTFDDVKPLVQTSPVRPSCYAFTPKGDAALVAFEDRSVARFDMTSGALSEIARVAGDVYQIAISPDGATAALGMGDGAVRLLDLSSGKDREIGRSVGPVRALAFSHDGRRLVAGTDEHTIRIFDLAAGTSLSRDTSGAGVLRVDFSPDDRTIFVQNGLEAVVHRWTADGASELPPLAGHTGPILGMHLAKSGRSLLTVSGDGTARLFDLATGRSRALDAHEGDLSAADFGPNDRVVVTLAKKGAARAWPDDLPDTLPALRAWINAATPDTIKPR